MILSDRKKDIFPNNVTLCKSNCQYKSMDYETQRIICECNLNKNNNYSDDIDDFSNEEEDDGNFITYFIDKINYKLFKCYELFLNFNNLINNVAFYTILSIFVLAILLSFTFLFCGIQNIRITMYKEIPTAEKVKEMVIKELKKRKNGDFETKLNPSKKNLNKVKVKKNLKTSPASSNNAKTYKNKKNKLKKDKENKKESQSNKELVHYKFKNDFKNKINKRNKDKKSDIILTGNYVNTASNLMKKKSKFEPISQKFNKKIKNKNADLVISDINSEGELEKQNPEELNVLPYTVAVRTDKRNIFQLFKSILFEKLELVNIFISGPRIRIICICEYILSLLFDFFFNALLYSDEIVSQKYHNNGKLDTYVSILISIVSNIITSFVCNIV